MIKYADRPMDLADAALVRVAEREGIRRIFTVERNDFTVYRLHGRVGLAIVPRSRTPEYESPLSRSARPTRVAQPSLARGRPIALTNFFRRE